MLEASQFVPVAFEATLFGYGLTKSIGRLAARLLAVHGDEVDDEVGLEIPKRSSRGTVLQLIFRERGILTVTPVWVRFEGLIPESIGPKSGWGSEPMQWAVELLMSIMNTQKAEVLALNSELTWLLREYSSTAPLVAHLGLSQTLGGLFAASEEFKIHGDTIVEIPNLFPVTCQMIAGRLINFNDPENVGVQILHTSPDNRIDLDDPINFSRALVDQFFVASPQLMERQLIEFFPIRGTA